MTSRLDVARNLIAFWIFGLCNNYAYVVMLSAAQDILNVQENIVVNSSAADQKCLPKIDKRLCESISTGAVLLADIIPCFIVKFTFPFFMQRMPFGVRNMLVILLQICSYLVVAFSVSVPMSLLGVVFASMSSGLGEITFLALTPNFNKNVISTWSSGTGGAGVLGAFSYAVLTEPHFANLTPSQATLVMLVIPALFAAAYWLLLVVPDSVYQIGLHPKSWIVPYSHLAKSDSSMTNSLVDSGTSVLDQSGQDSSDSVDTTSSECAPSNDKFIKQRSLSFPEKMGAVLPLLKYMIPLMLVYLGEYLINQGIVQLIVFDCDHSFKLSKASQYRWYQVLYQVGVFISRSSINIIRLNYAVLLLLPVFQTCNVFVFLFESLYHFIPQIWILFLLILFEGLFGGASYVNTFRHIHDASPPDIREYAMSISSLGDTIGICIAGFASIPLHNAICRTSY
ncbi:hypothetical protein AB6A40_007170 [Gnathostoma spinigerum]|uniref:Battenin n=1 Tax=Gnathostoma spinigerum TaxID=75299 RepID=A0ABD6EMF6_9BILA